MPHPDALSPPPLWYLRRAHNTLQVGNPSTVLANRAGAFGLRPLYCPWPRSTHRLGARPFALRPSALRGTSDGATMVAPGGAGTTPVTVFDDSFLLGAPASLIGSELPWLTGSGLYTVLGRAFWNPSLARPSLCALEALRTRVCRATISSPVGRAQN